MLLLTRRIEHPLDVAVQRSHHAYPGEHRRTVKFRNEEERRHRGLPCFRIVLYLGQFSDEERGVAKRGQRLPARQYDRIVKPFDPTTPKLPRYANSSAPAWVNDR